MHLKLQQLILQKRGLMHLKLQQHILPKKEKKKEKEKRGLIHPLRN